MTKIVTNYDDFTAFLKAQPAPTELSLHETAVELGLCAQDGTVLRRPLPLADKMLGMRLHSRDFFDMWTAQPFPVDEERPARP